MTGPTQHYAHLFCECDMQQARNGLARTMRPSVDPDGHPSQLAQPSPAPFSELLLEESARPTCYALLYDQNRNNDCTKQLCSMHRCI